MARSISFRPRTVVTACAFALALGVAGLALDGRPSAAERSWPAVPAELEKTREALTKYQDPVVAVRDGYFSTLGCVMYPDGGMGIHFINVGLIGPEVDPMKPPILIYEPVGDELRLVAAEWFVPLATGIKERPSLLGQPFDGPMAGHEPLMPKELHHYDLHVWLFKENPAGLFATTNPDVDCGTGRYVQHEEPPPAVPHH